MNGRKSNEINKQSVSFKKRTEEQIFRELVSHVITSTSKNENYNVFFCVTENGNGSDRSGWGSF